MKDDPTKILQYLNDLMTREERDAFEKELEDSPELAKKTKELALESEALLALASQDLKQKAMAAGILSDYEVQHASAKHARVRDIRKPLLWQVMTFAAAIAIIIATGIIISKQNIEVGIDFEDLENEHSTSPLAVAQNLLSPLELGSLRSNTTELSLEERALAAYSEGQYDLVLSTLKGISVDSLPSKLKLIKGYCHLTKKDFAEAEVSFAGVANSSIFFPSSQWFLALSLVFQDKNQQAAMLLQEIRKDSVSDYRKEAEILLESIKTQSEP
ncbi:MAG: hypothetical protein R3B47_10725 [Bacteroidia bacterium]